MSKGHGGVSRPQWLREWIANQPRFVLLACGHKDDINIPYTIIFGFPEVQVLCDRCASFQPIRKYLNLQQYAEFAAKPIPDEPLF